MTHKPLKLFGRTAEDMDIMSAHIQDAVLQINMRIYKIYGININQRD